MRGKNNYAASEIIIAICSFIPLLGILFGIISIVIGFQKKLRTLIFAGIGGILFSIILYSCLFYFGFYSDKSSESWNVFTKNDLNKGFIYIEYFKIQNGTYPDSINYLKDYDIFVKFIDTPKGNNFYYEKISDSTYYFFGLGKDEEPFTEDDIYPEIVNNNSLRQNGLMQK